MLAQDWLNKTIQYLTEYFASGGMTSKEQFTDDLINQLVRTAVDLKRETTFVEGAAEVASETAILGSILARYFKKSGRKIAEIAYWAFDAVELTVDALAFSEIWSRSNPEQNDLGPRKMTI